MLCCAQDCPNTYCSEAHLAKQSPADFIPPLSSPFKCYLHAPHSPYLQHDAESTQTPRVSSRARKVSKRFEEFETPFKPCVLCCWILSYFLVWISLVDFHFMQIILDRNTAGLAFTFPRDTHAHGCTTACFSTAGQAAAASK